MPIDFSDLVEFILNLTGRVIVSGVGKSGHIGNKIAASEIAQILRGKHKPQYAPHLDVGDHVVVINAGQIGITSKKPEQKMYHSHSGYPGGIKSESFNSLRERKPEKIIERAVWGMLPKNRLGRATIKKLHIYSTDKHPHVAQNPVELNFDIKKVEE